MLKKLTAAAVASVLLLSSVCVFAQETAETQRIENISAELSLEGAVEIARRNNPRIVAADAAIKSAELSYDVVKESQKEFDRATKYVNVPVVISEGLETAYLKHGYYPLAAQVGIDLAVLAKTQVEDAIAYEVTEKYYNVKLMEKLLDITKYTCTIAEDNLELMKNHYAVGYVSALDVQSAENALMSAQNSVASYERTLSLAMKSLQVSLQLDEIDCELELTDEIVLPNDIEEGEAKVQAAVDTRYDITALKKDFELKNEMFEITKKYMGEHTAKYNSAYSDYLNSKYTYENTTKMILIGLENELAAITGAKDTLRMAEKDLELKEALYESAKIKFDLGLITNLELMGALADAEGSRLNLENAKTAYALAVIKFEYNTNIGI